jgi:hypothetical protein
MNFAHKLIIVFFTALLVTTSVFAQTDTIWDGVWSGYWAKDTSTKIVISGGKVTEYWFRQKQEPGLLDTSISGNVLKFRVGEAVITISKTSPTGAYAHFMVGSHEATASLTRQY